MLTWVQSRPWIQRCVLIAGFIAAALHGYVITYLRVFHLRDFDAHREFGRRFLEGTYLYAGGLCYPYMPSAAMYFAPLALLDRNTGLALRYAVAVVCLYLTLFLLYRMVRGRSEMTTSDGFWIGAGVVFLALQFIIQDLDDGGPHLILLAILTAGIYSVWQGRETVGALWFGSAIALKVSTVLFLPFFLWKRRWRLAGYTATVTLCWVLLPMVWMGPESWWNHQREWAQVVSGSVVGQEAPTAIENEQRVRNQSLRQTLIRYLATFPANHPLRRDDPGYRPFLDLSPSTARMLVIVVMAGLLICFCWYARRPYEGHRDPAWLRESSVVMILMLLLSPVTWVQHLVWLVPALYLILVDAHSREGLRNSAKIALGVYVALTVVLNYELLGKGNFALFLSYHPFTVAMVLVLAMVTFGRQTSEAGEAVTR